MTLEEIYSSLPEIQCKQLCFRFCADYVPVTELEMRGISRLLGYRPNWKHRSNRYCPMLKLDTKDCRIYSRRPIMCRLWGLTEVMRCPHGCEPERFLTEEEATEIFRQVEEADGQASQG